MSDARDDGPNYSLDDSLGINDLAERIHGIAAAHGFWPKEGRNFGEIIALIHSEASEALEEHRSGKPAFYLESQSYGPDKPEGTLVELMDIVIRVLDVAQDIATKADLDIEVVLMQKIKFNESRPHKHGRNY